MLRCIQLAKNGIGTTSPNPLVGAVIVYNDVIIGEGWHYQAGLPHAEVNAINSVSSKNESKFTQATIYVSLEPCSHHGKTPPCANLLIEKGIKKVVIGSTDPNPKVSGSGVALLESNGIEVITGICKESCNQLNRSFFTFHKYKKPYVVLKWAETLDGFIAPLEEVRQKKKPFWITNELSRQYTHKMRSEVDAILIGTKTVMADNPSLTTRNWHGTSPVRVIIDRDLSLSDESAVFDGTVKTIIITQKIKQSTENLLYETIDFSEKNCQQICEILYKFQLQSVLIEGGAKTLQSFIDSNLWDEAFIFSGIKEFKQGIKAPLLNGNFISKKIFKEDTLSIYKNSSLWLPY